MKKVPFVFASTIGLLTAISPAFASTVVGGFAGTMLLDQNDRNGTPNRLCMQESFGGVQWNCFPGTSINDGCNCEGHQITTWEIPLNIEQPPLGGSFSTVSAEFFLKESSPGMIECELASFNTNNGQFSTSGFKIAQNGILPIETSLPFAPGAAYYGACTLSAQLKGTIGEAAILYNVFYGT